MGAPSRDSGLDTRGDFVWLRDVGMFGGIPYLPCMGKGSYGPASSVSLNGKGNIPGIFPPDYDFPICRIGPTWVSS